MGVKVNNRSLGSIKSNNRVIAYIKVNGRIVWSTINSLIQSCFASGKWIDTYKWTDDQPWKD